MRACESLLPRCSFSACANMKLLVRNFRNYPCNIPFRTTPQLQTLFPLGLTRRKHCIQELRMSFLETCPYNSLDILTALYASHSLIPKHPKTSRIHRTQLAGVCSANSQQFFHFHNTFLQAFDPIHWQLVSLTLHHVLNKPQLTSFAYSHPL
jgi:hypothetical protein